MAMRIVHHFRDRAARFHALEINSLHSRHHYRPIYNRNLRAVLQISSGKLHAKGRDNENTHLASKSVPYVATNRSSQHHNFSDVRLE